MSNEAETPVVEAQEPVVEAAEPSVPELTPVEQQAMTQGWVPLEQWKESGRDETEWRPAKEYVERGELYKSIHSTKKELKQTQAALTALQRHHTLVFQKAHEQALRDLRAEKRLAIRNEDFERVEEIETEIDERKDQFQKEAMQLHAEQVQAQQAVNPEPEFQMWLSRNQWYVTDPSMREEADAAGFIHLNKGGSKESMLAAVETAIRKKFPEKFGIRKAAPSAVASVNRTTGKKSSGGNPSINDLPAEMQQVVKRMVDATGMSEAAYIKQLKDNGVI